MMMGRSRVVRVTISVVVFSVLGIACTESEDLTSSNGGNEIESLVEEVASTIRDKYVFPEVGDNIAVRLRELLDAGHFSEIGSIPELASSLQQVALSISNDRHFEITAVGEQPTSLAAPPDRPADFGINHGFRRVEILPGNIGYVRIEKLPGSEADLKAADAVMAFLSESRILIFDIRDNGGGSGDMVTHLCSYLFHEPTLLFTVYDRDGVSVSTGRTTSEISGRRFDAEIPVYILTSRHTISAAEGLAFVLQRKNRATIVGETTAGMAHPSSRHIVGDRIRLVIPYLRVGDPTTGADWEGIGVKPDIVVEPETALSKAIELARGRL